MKNNSNGPLFGGGLPKGKLVELASYSGVGVSLEEKKKWFAEHGMSYPYRLTYNGRIIECITGRVINDSECDKLILDQANELRADQQRKGDR